MKTAFYVASILPFWRYAVVPASNGIPGIPFYSKKKAFAWMHEVEQRFPDRGIYLIRRPFLSREVSIVKFSRGQA
jgi:hypothetical protein